MKNVFVILFCLFCFGGFTQSSRIFIAKEGRGWMLGINPNARFLRLDTDLGADKLHYQDGIYSLGFRVRRNKIGLGLNIPLIRTGKDVDQGSQHYKLQIEGFLKDIYINLASDYLDGMTISKLDGSSDFSYQRSYLSMRFSSVYAFQHNKYSQKAAIRYLERQLQTGGSPLVQLSGGYRQIGDFSLLHPFVVSATDKIKNFRLGLGLGYGFSYVKNEWFITGSGVFAAETVQSKIEATKHKSQDLGLRFQPTLSMGYQNEVYYGGILFQNSFDISPAKTALIKQQVALVTLNFGRRFGLRNSFNDEQISSL